MPLFYKDDLNINTSIAVWKIEEPEEFFLSEVTILRQITHPQKRLQHLAARYLLTLLVPDFPHHQISIASTKKPFLPNEKYHFSISHCGSYAAVIISATNRVGVDVEYYTDRLHTIKHKFLHTEELAFVNDQLLKEQTILLTILWSAKEAIYKWYGLGEVDFSEMMRTFPFLHDKQGTITGKFVKADFRQDLALSYKLWNDVCLVWLLT